MPSAIGSVLLLSLAVAACSTTGRIGDTSSAQSGALNAARPGSARSSAPPAAPSAAEPRPRPSVAPFEIVAGVVAGCDLAVDQKHLYFAASAPIEQGGTLARIPKAGRSPEILTPNHAWIDEFVLQGDALIFADIQVKAAQNMAPGMNGFELLEEFREISFASGSRIALRKSSSKNLPAWRPSLVSWTRSSSAATNYFGTTAAI